MSLRENSATGRKETAGPSTTLRSGRDDNSVVPQELQLEIPAPATKLSSRPERSVVEGPAVSFPDTHAVSLAPVLRPRHECPTRAPAW
jgi:hypothetical protein